MNKQTFLIETDSNSFKEPKNLKLLHWIDAQHEIPFIDAIRSNKTKPLTPGSVAYVCVTNGNLIHWVKLKPIGWISVFTVKSFRKANYMKCEVIQTPETIAPSLQLLKSGQFIAIKPTSIAGYTTQTEQCAINN